MDNPICKNPLTAHTMHATFWRTAKFQESPTVIGKSTGNTELGITPTIQSNLCISIYCISFRQFSKELLSFERRFHPIMHVADADRLLHVNCTL